MPDQPTETAGVPETTLNKVLETGAGMTQNFAPTQRICAHLNAFHAYAHDPKRPAVESNHYCAHVNDEVRQCVLYDSAEPGARIIGIEYMISEALFKTLDAYEQRLWHSHVFEVASGMLMMPRPPLVPAAVWDVAEKAEMAQVVQLYGKVWQLWQTNRGDKLPLGKPQLMTSYTAEDQMPDFERRVEERDARFGSDFRRAREARSEMERPEVVGGADATWKEGGER